MSHLNDFQNKTEIALISALASNARELESREVVVGKDETYIEANISQSPLKVYIYEDGAEISGGGISAIFEIQDFDTLDDLMDVFVYRASNLALHPDPQRVEIAPKDALLAAIPALIVIGGLVAAEFGYHLIGYGIFFLVFGTILIKMSPVAKKSLGYEIAKQEKKNKKFNKYVYAVIILMTVLLILFR